MNPSQLLAAGILGQSALILAVACAAARAVHSPSARVAILRYAFAGVVGMAVLRVAVPNLANPWLSRTVQPGPL